VQETFIRAWRHLPQLVADDRPVRPWLFQVARNLLIDAGRAARSRPVTVPEQSAEDGRSDAELTQVLDRQLVSGALRHLSPARACQSGRRWASWAALVIGAASAPQAAASGFRAPYTIPNTATAALGIALTVVVLATIGRPAPPDQLAGGSCSPRRAADPMTRGPTQRRRTLKANASPR
jgi:hypothetical protein